MNDREKVISGFQQWCNEKDEDCPVICLDALALLKDQAEPVKKLYDINGKIMHNCPRCGAYIEKFNPWRPWTPIEYCGYCGKAVKFE